MTDVASHPIDNYPLFVIISDGMIGSRTNLRVNQTYFAPLLRPERYDRAPEGSQIDLHSLTPWSAQLMLLHFLKTIAGRIDDGWEFPKADMTIITGRGNHSPNKSSLVRDVTLRFLQVSRSSASETACSHVGLMAVRGSRDQSFELEHDHEQDIRAQVNFMAWM